MAGCGRQGAGPTRPSTGSHPHWWDLRVAGLWGTRLSGARRVTPSEVVAVISAAGVALGGLVTAVSVLAGIKWGREKAKAETLLTREQVGKARAEREQAETSATLEAIAGKIDQRLDALENSLSEVHHEVTPNHGGSIKDAVKRIEDGQAAVRAALDAHGQVLAAHGQVLDQITDRQDRDMRDIRETASAEHERLRSILTTIKGEEEF
nr:MAG TPA: hypothetical protein [Caudoviricetes sp.]